MSLIIAWINLCLSVVLILIGITITLKIIVQLIPEPSYQTPDFALLASLLAEKQWEQADMETKRIILWTVGFPSESDYMPSRLIQFFPCDVLHTIDQLWSTSSNRQFGFTAQKQVALEAELIQDKQWTMHKAFAERLGWSLNGCSIRYENLNFSDDAPLGHLPAGKWWITEYRVHQTLEILQRLELCDTDDVW